MLELQILFRLDSTRLAVSSLPSTPGDSFILNAQTLEWYQSSHLAQKHWLPLKTSLPGRFFSVLLTSQELHNNLSYLGCLIEFGINNNVVWHCRWSLFLSLADLKLFLLLYCFLLHLWCITPPTWHAVLFSSLVVRWWARQIVKNIPPSDTLEVRAKVAALTALSGERKDWGFSRAWERDYLANVRITQEQKQKTK